jgi:hypothetical protein
MVIRCKFKVDSIERRKETVAKFVDGKKVYEPGETWTVRMSPVYANDDPNHENSKFWAASPSGSFEVRTVNKAAVESLELSGEYYLDITPAPK